MPIYQGEGKKEQATEDKDTPLIRLCIDTAPAPKRSNQFSESQLASPRDGIPPETKNSRRQVQRALIWEVVEFTCLTAQQASTNLEMLQSSAKVDRQSLQMTSKNSDASQKDILQNPHGKEISGEITQVVNIKPISGQLKDLLTFYQLLLRGANGMVPINSNFEHNSLATESAQVLCFTD